jgi:hypothetical protein
MIAEGPLPKGDAVLLVSSWALTGRFGSELPAASFLLALERIRPPLL